jgi:hypothetical protein
LRRQEIIMISPLPVIGRARQADDDAIAKLVSDTFGRVAGRIFDACPNGEMPPAASLTP